MIVPRIFPVCRLDECLVIPVDASTIKHHIFVQFLFVVKLMQLGIAECHLAGYKTSYLLKDERVSVVPGMMGSIYQRNYTGPESCFSHVSARSLCSESIIDDYAQVIM